MAVPSSLGSVGCVEVTVSVPLPNPSTTVTDCFSQRRRLRFEIQTAEMGPGDDVEYPWDSGYPTPYLLAVSYLSVYSHR